MDPIDFPVRLFVGSLSSLHVALCNRTVSIHHQTLDSGNRINQTSSRSSAVRVEATLFGSETESESFGGRTDDTDHYAKFSLKLDVFEIVF